MTPRQDIEIVRTEVLGLHKRLIDAARLQYEARHGSVVRPGELLRLFAFDPEFAWLKPLTQIILDIDERLDGPDAITDVDVAEVHAEVDRVLGSAEQLTEAMPQA